MNNIFRLLILAALVILIASCGGTQKPKKQTSKPTQQVTTPSVTAQELSPLNKSVFEQAVENINNNQLKAAKKSLKKLHKSTPNHPGILSNLAAVEYMNDNLEQAEAYVDRALAISKESAHAHNIKGLISVKSGKVKEAERSYLLAIKFDDKYADAYYNVALVYDTYYQDLAMAVKYYKAYLVLSGFTDEDTKKWIRQLESSIETDK